MTTKNLIKEKSRELFNQRGVMNVTLRDVSKGLNKSYGNLTYHYPTKELLVMELYKEMNLELSNLQAPIVQYNLLEYFLLLPSSNYEITLKYLFFTIDFVEIKRNMPNVFSEILRMNEERKVKWLKLIKELHSKGYLKSTLQISDFDYIMFLSGSVRASYFQVVSSLNYSKDDYCKIVNLLLKPYLSEKGLKVFTEFDS